MIQIQVLGFDCAACHKAYRLINEVAGELGILIELSKVSDPQLLMQYKVLSVPAIIIDHQLVFQGSCPNRKTITGWLKNAA